MIKVTTPGGGVKFRPLSVHFSLPGHAQTYLQSISVCVTGAQVYVLVLPVKTTMLEVWKLEPCIEVMWTWIIVSDLCFKTLRFTN